MRLLCQGRSNEHADERKRYLVSHDSLSLHPSRNNVHFGNCLQAPEAGRVEEVVQLGARRCSRQFAARF